MSIFDLLRINGRDMWQVEKPEIFQCRNGEKTRVTLIPVRAGESLNVGKCDTVWDIDEEEEIIDEADQKAIYDEMKWDE